MNLANKAGRIQHYLLEANPFKTVDSLSKLIENNLYLTDNKDIVIVNKPPGFILASCSCLIKFLKILFLINFYSNCTDKSNDTKNFIDIVKENIKKKLDWKTALRLPIVTE